MDEPDKLPLVQKALNVLIDQLQARGPGGDGGLCRRCRRRAAADGGQREAEDALRRRGAACRRLDRGRGRAGARLRSGRAEFRQGRRQPRRADDRRRLQRRRRRSGQARGLHRREAQDRRLSLGLRRRPRQLQRPDDADALPGRQRHGGLHRHARRGAQAVPRRLLRPRCSRSPTTSRSRSSSIRPRSPSTA